MATAKTNSDALGWYHTGANGRGSSQTDADACLGGKRAGTEVCALAPLINNPIPAIIINHVTGDNGTGAATIQVTGASAIKYTAPSGTLGAEVTIADGATALLEDDDTDKAIRIERDGSDDLGNIVGDMELELVYPFGSVVGMDNVTNAERAAGLNTYRASMLRAHGTQQLTLLKVWVGTLGTQRVTDSAQLGAAGAGTITTTGSFADWPIVGYAHIKTNAGATREIVYYTVRTTTSLTVLAAGRARLGSAAGAGANDDTVDAVPGIRLAAEAPDGNGDIQTIANETTAPAAVSWDSGCTAATGLSIGTVNASANYGLWIHRDTPASTVVSAKMENKINFSFTAGGTGYTGTISGLYRVSDTTIEAYELYVGADADPDLTAAPDATSTTGLPFSHALASSSGDIEYRYTVLYRNEYDLLSLNQYWRKVVVGSGGVTATADPSAPEDITLTNVAGGEVDVSAVYYPDHDLSPADTWAIYATINGIDPTTGTVTPITETMAETAYFGLPSRRLQYALGPYGKNVDLRVLLRARRSSDSAESDNTTVSSTTVSTIVPIMPGQRSAFFGDAYVKRMAPPTVSETVTYDVGNNVYADIAPGMTDLWADTTLVFRLKYDELDPDNNGFWTTFGIKQEAISGAASTEPLETQTWTTGSKILNVTVDETRRMKIDVTNALISIAAVNEVAADCMLSHTTEPLVDLDQFTAFQGWDRHRWDFQTGASLDSTGVFSMALPWRQRNTSGDFE